MNKLICFIINGLFTAFFIIFLGSVVVGLFFLFTGGSVIIASIVATTLTVGLGWECYYRLCGSHLRN